MVPNILQETISTVWSTKNDYLGLHKQQNYLTKLINSLVDELMIMTFILY